MPRVVYYGKALCAQCFYLVRISGRWAAKGAPLCPTCDGNPQMVMVEHATSTRKNPETLTVKRTPNRFRIDGVTPLRR